MRINKIKVFVALILTVIFFNGCCLNKVTVDIETINFLKTNIKLTIEKYDAAKKEIIELRNSGKIDDVTWKKLSELDSQLIKTYEVLKPILNNKSNNGLSETLNKFAEIFCNIVPILIPNVNSDTKNTLLLLSSIWASK